MKTLTFTPLTEVTEYRVSGSFGVIGTIAQNPDDYFVFFPNKTPIEYRAVIEIANKLSNLNDNVSIKLTFDE